MPLRQQKYKKHLLNLGEATGREAMGDGQGKAYPRPLPKGRGEGKAMGRRDTQYSLLEVVILE